MKISRWNPPKFQLGPAPRVQAHAVEAKLVQGYALSYFITHTRFGSDAFPLGC